MLDNKFPLPHAVRVHRERNQRSLCPQSEHRRQRGRARETTEKRAPHACITGVLIEKHANCAAFPQHVHRLRETFLPLEKRKPEASPRSADMRVDITIPELLIHRAARTRKHDRPDLRQQFPVTDVTHQRDDSALLRDERVDDFAAFDRHDALHTIPRKPSDFLRGEQVSDQRGKVAACECAELRRGLFGKCDGEISQCDSPVLAGDEIATKPDQTTEPHNPPERKEPEHKANRAIELIDDEIRHGFFQCNNRNGCSSVRFPRTPPRRSPS